MLLRCSWNSLQEWVLGHWKVHALGIEARLLFEVRRLQNVKKRGSQLGV
jgi:hypothetical protein